MEGARDLVGGRLILHVITDDGAVRLERVGIPRDKVVLSGGAELGRQALRVAAVVFVEIADGRQKEDAVLLQFISVGIYRADRRVGFGDGGKAMSALLISLTPQP